ncbi:phosphoglycerate dehydrogenase [Planctomyces sp. SH-PL14]|uniref:phosphoglycerate dehydrogenase n=1 Tax=Planctomyces sp. SH-PL14 TaxID=1632864 RepID=UPI00078CF3CD|nr:phosphoglycerate dehydrogenase [Planctomyces sp. SH-PL14]AMV19680.1 D-3-phosphoglycerate dehydrogenase [Planctomyces sp. SH-PL14]
MYRVLITDDLSKAGIKLLSETPGIEVVSLNKPTPDQVKEALKSSDAIIVRSATKLTPALLEGQTRLKLIVRAGVGVDNIDLPAATRQGIIVMNTPAGNTTSTAEHTIAMLMALSRFIGPAHASMKEGKWDRKSFTGVQLAGKTIAVVGLGRIGLSVARRANALEMKVLGYDPFLSHEKAAENGIELYRDIDELITKCDYLTVHTPFTEETKGLINAPRLAKMKKGVRIVNCARGGIVDEAALADAIESGHVAGAALDVFVKEPPEPENRLPKLPQVLATPHLGASTDEAQEQVAIEAAELVAAFLTKNEVRCAVNMVSISAQEMEGLRPYLDLGYRLGTLLAQLTRGSNVQGVNLQYKGDAASRPTKMITSAFVTGLMGQAVDEVNIVNAELIARDKGLNVTTSSISESGPFSTLVSATVVTDKGEQCAAGTTFGNEFLRLVRLNSFPMDAYLDGLLLIYRHKDVPGLIGSIGTVLGKHKVNISSMALGREKNQPGGNAVAILNLDNEPSAAALEEVSKHPDVTGVQLVKLPGLNESIPKVGI